MINKLLMFVFLGIAAICFIIGVLFIWAGPVPFIFFLFALLAFAVASYFWKKDN